MKNSADLGGCYPPRPSAYVDSTLRDLQNSSYPTQPHSVIAKYVCFVHCQDQKRKPGQKHTTKTYPTLMFFHPSFLYTYPFYLLPSYYSQNLSRCVDCTLGYTVVLYLAPNVTFSFMHLFPLIV